MKEIRNIITATDALVPSRRRAISSHNGVSCPVYMAFSLENLLESFRIFMQVLPKVDGWYPIILCAFQQS